MLKIQKNLTNTFYAILSLPATAMGFALCIQISALSWILSTKYGLRIDEIGLVWAAGPIAGILGQVVIGLISDNVWIWNGRRRPFIIIGGVLAALMLLALPNIDVISKALGIDGILGVAIVVALTLDLAINVSFNPTRSIIADVTPEGVERTKGYTWMQTISGTFGVLAYIIGAYLGNYVLIYFGVFLVLVLSLIPSFFIEEPRQLKNAEEIAKQPVQKTSFSETMLTIQPLWGFLIYAVFAITRKLAGWQIDNYYFEYFCLALTIVLIIMSLTKSEEGKSVEKAGLIAFKKVLAAHSFTWIGIQTMFIYTFNYVETKVPDCINETKIAEFIVKQNSNFTDSKQKIIDFIKNEKQCKEIKGDSIIAEFLTTNNLNGFVDESKLSEFMKQQPKNATLYSAIANFLNKEKKDTKFVDAKNLTNYYSKKDSNAVNAHNLTVFITSEKIKDKLSEQRGSFTSIAFLILNAIGAILPAYILEPVARRRGRVKTHAICIASMALGYLAIATLGFSSIIVFILMGILGIGWASTISLPFAIMTQKVDKGRIGLYMGLFNLSVVLPQLVASLGVGQAVAHNTNLTFYICAATLAFSAIAWFLVKDVVAKET